MGSNEEALLTAPADEAEGTATPHAPQRARTVFAVAVGSEMDAEWETSRVPQALRRLAAAARTYAPHGGPLTVIHYGSRVRVGDPTTFDEFERVGLLDRPDCGPGANLSGAIYGALSQREGDERLHLYVISDCNMDPAELERAKRVVEHARNLVVVVVRVSTDADGLDAAYELDEFAAGNDDNVELVHYSDGHGRDVGANLEGHVSRRMNVILARHYKGGEHAVAA